MYGLPSSHLKPTTGGKSQESEKRFCSLMQREESMPSSARMRGAHSPDVTGMSVTVDEKREVGKRGAMTDALVIATDPTVASRRRIGSRDWMRRL